MSRKFWLCAFVMLVAFTGITVAQEMAISTQAGWFGQAAADREAGEIQSMVTGVNVVLFTADEQAALADWVVAKTADGKPDILLLCGQLPDTIYEPGNTQADDSLVELFLDDGDGNFVLNTGDYLAYVVNSGGTNAAAGLQTLMDIPDITMWDDNTAMVPTNDGAALTPSLAELQSDRPFHLDELDDNWEAELVLAQNDTGTRADPVIVQNVNTKGRLGIFYQTASQDDDPRSEVISEWVNNWYMANTTAVEATSKATTTWGSLKSR